MVGQRFPRVPLGTPLPLHNPKFLAFLSTAHAYLALEYGLWIFTKLLFPPSMGTSHLSLVVGITHQVSGRVGIFKSAPTSVSHTLSGKPNKGLSPGCLQRRAVFVEFLPVLELGLGELR